MRMDKKNVPGKNGAIYWNDMIKIDRIRVRSFFNMRLAERIDYLEKLLGESAEKHAQAVESRSNKYLINI